MNRSKFLRAYNKASTQLDKRRMKKIIRRLIDSSVTSDKLLIMIMEELAELSQQVSKVARGQGDGVCLVEEMADVALSLADLKEICGVSTMELYRAMNVKLDRVERILNEKGEYK